MASDTAATRPLQRKVATILSADVAGYSRLMADDEERTLMVFRDHKQVFEDLIAQHEGRIFNTAGDAILAEFASAVEAVRCATEIQAALRTRNDQLPPARRVEFRLGVNLGDVMVHGTDLLGDGVNVAARLQAAAEPGGVCISGSVYDQIRNKLSLTFRSLGEQNYKNIPQPVRTFSIAGTGAEGGPPAARPRAALPAAVLFLVLAAAGGGWWAFERHQAPAPVAAAAGPADTGQDGPYDGPVCYGAAANDQARCYHAQGTVRDGKILGEWPGGNQGITMILSGEVAADGAVKILLRGETADGNRRFTIDLAGMLRDGRLETSGTFRNGRTATLNWRRSAGSAATLAGKAPR